jgi:hypothetical protein
MNIGEYLFRSDECLDVRVKAKDSHGNASS